MKTRAAVVEAQGQPFTLAEVELDEPREDEVLVRMVATGICHTDITMGSFLPAEMFPNVFGHEGAGVVEAVGADVHRPRARRPRGDELPLLPRLRQVQRPAWWATATRPCCSTTWACGWTARTSISRDGSPVFGYFFGQSSLAAHALAYADNCVEVDPELDLTLLAPYGCGFQTGAGTILNVLRPGTDDSLVVYGVGAVGLAAIAAAAAEGVESIVAVDPLASRREVAERFGAPRVDPATSARSVVDRVKELTGGGATYGIDTTAIPEVVKQAQQSLAVRGTLVAIGLGAEEYALDAIDLLQGGKTVMARSRATPTRRR